MPNPIQPVKVIAASDLEENGGVYLVQKGIPAIPVHGFTAQGNRAVKGVARPVYVVSEAEFNAGDFVKAHGQPQPVGDIDDLGFVGALEGREAIPVWAVNDWPSSSVLPFIGAYDDIPNLVHVYEPARRTLTSYTGPLVRIRRSSDNVEQDFGADTGGNLDTAAITTFLGGSSGFVVTVYDQVGSDNPTQATAGNQPAYVANGQNGKPVMRFDGASDRLRISTGALSQPYHVYVVGMANAVGANMYLFDGFTNRSGVFYGSLGTLLSLFAGNVLASAQAPGAWHVIAALFNGGSSAIFEDSVSVASGNAGTQDITGVTIGAAQPVTTFLNGDIASVVIADPSHSTAQREAMQDAINDYWAVY